MFSEIVKSYSVFGCLPEVVSVYPWSVISNSSTVFVTMDVIVNKSSYLVSYVESNQSLPGNLSVSTVNGVKVVNLAQFLKLNLDCLVNICVGILSTLYFLLSKEGSASTPFLK